MGKFFGKIKILLVIFLVLIIFLWVLTNQWMADGEKPLADGTNDYAVILGAKVNGTKPSLSLQYRLDAALEYGKKYPHVKFILSGGKGPDEEISEAEAMRRFLVENGIAEERLFLETESTSTYENLLYSKKMLPDSVRTITIVSNDYHLKRAKMIADHLGLKADVVPAKTPKMVEAKLKFRERLALIKTYIIGK